MGIVTLQFNIQNGGPLDADQVMANLNAILAVLNGGVDSSNVVADVPIPLDGGSATVGDSLGLALASHKHVVQGVEQLNQDPTTANFPGRAYQDTSNNRIRYCVSVNGDGTGNWITIANMQAGDLPNHAARHASGQADALPAGSVDATMLNRTLTTGTMASSTITVSANAWTDVITGVAPTITGTQVAVVHCQIGVTMTNANVPNVNFRLLDQNSAVLAQTSSFNMGAAKFFHPAWHLSFTATPTLKLQINADTTGVQVNKTTTTNGSTGTATKMDVLVG